MAGLITREMIEFLDELTPIGWGLQGCAPQSILIEDMNDIAPEIKTLRNKNLVRVERDSWQHPSYSELSHQIRGKITITQEGVAFCKRALQSINHLPLFNNASKETAYA